MAVIAIRSTPCADTFCSSHPSNSPFFAISATDDRPSAFCISHDRIVGAFSMNNSLFDVGAYGLRKARWALVG